MSPFDTREQYRAHQLSTIWTDALYSRYKKDVEVIAKRAHECNMAHNSFGECTVKDMTSWENLPQESKDSVIEIVLSHIRSPIVSGANSSEESHNRWIKSLTDRGWVYKAGPKDPVNKTHPLLKEYSQLTEADRAKDHIFQAVVRQGIWELAERVLILFKTELGNAIN